MTLWQVVEPGIRYLPLTSPTLPPATHTNCVVIGEETLIVVDPGSPYEDEQAKLDAALAELEAAGGRVVGVVLTHHHLDHVAGLEGLLAKRPVEVWAHPWEAAKMGRSCRRLLAGQRVGVGAWAMEVIGTPGHTRGHLSLFHRASRVLVAGDLVAGAGTIIVAPPDGDMVQYMGSLRMAQALAVNTVIPSHGGVLPAAVFEMYVMHRQMREGQLLEAGAAGVRDEDGLVTRMYHDVPQAAWPLAKQSVRAQLKKLRAEGRWSQNA